MSPRRDFFLQVRCFPKRTKGSGSLRVDFFEEPDIDKFLDVMTYFELYERLNLIIHLVRAAGRGDMIVVGRAVELVLFEVTRIAELGDSFGLIRAAGFGDTIGLDEPMKMYRAKWYETMDMVT